MTAKWSQVVHALLQSRGNARQPSSGIHPVLLALVCGVVCLIMPLPAGAQSLRCCTCEGIIVPYGTDGEGNPIIETCPIFVTDDTGEIDCTGGSATDFLCSFVCCADFDPPELREWALILLCDFAEKCGATDSELLEAFEHCVGPTGAIERELLEACGDDDSDSDIGPPNDDNDTGDGEGNAGDGSCGGPGGGPGAGGGGPGGPGGPGGGPGGVPPGGGSSGSPDGGSPPPPEQAPIRPQPIITPYPVSVGYGSKIESVVDMEIPLRGADFRIIREYTSDPNWSDANGPAGSSNDLVGENWTLSVFRFLKVDLDGSTPIKLRLYGVPVRHRLEFTKPGSVWTAGGPTTQYITESTLTIGSTTYDVWRLIEPGAWELDFFRGGSSLPPELLGLVAQQRDVYGNKHTFACSLYGPSMTKRARLRTIYLNGTGPSDSEGELRFTWHLRGARGFDKPYLGKLVSIALYRP